MSRFSFINENQQSELEIVSTDWRPQVEIIFQKEKGKDREKEVINIAEFINIKGEKALGNKLSSKKIKEINLLDPLPYIEITSIEKKEEANEQVFISKISENIKLEEVTTKIDLNINSESIEQKNPESSEDKDTEGQITLEL